MTDNKYKDDSPINTVDKIKNILSNNNILVTELNWKNSAKGYYSLSLAVDKTHILTNGKGTTKEYALASAYAELMERLQNQTFFRLAFDLNIEDMKFLGFFHAPDEKISNIYNWLETSCEWLEIQKSISNIDNKIIEMWERASFEHSHNNFVTIPYLNLSTNNLSYIPVSMVSTMYLSNGMSAGNSFEEAMVQGLSEIFERYVNQRIILDKICPPTISIEYLKKYPRIVDMIKEIENSGDYKIIIKDCSLGRNYPVVSAIYINRENQTYFVKFGSHPKIEIALERTLTELLQGQDIKKMMGVTEFSYYPPLVSEEKNIMGILTVGSGHYPTEFFSSDFSYEFSDINSSFSSNKEMLNHLLNILNKENYQVFIRDVSFMGFPSYHIIIPGFSEIKKLDDIDTLNDDISLMQIKKLIRNINLLTHDGKAKLLSLIDEYNIYDEISLMKLLNLDISQNIVPWYYNSIILFKIAANFELGNFDKAYQLISIYLNKILVNPNNEEIYKYYKCVRDYIGISDKSPNQVNILKLFYPEDLINEIVSIYKKPKSIFDYYGLLNCWNCKNCFLQNNCSYHNVSDIYKKIKSIYNRSVIDQNNNRIL